MFKLNCVYNNVVVVVFFYRLLVLFETTKNFFFYFFTAYLKTKKDFKVNLCIILGFILGYNDQNLIITYYLLIFIYLWLFHLSTKQLSGEKV